MTPQAAYLAWLGRIGGYGRLKDGLIGVAETPPFLMWLGYLEDHGLAFREELRRPPPPSGLAD